jgi:UDP-N-acetylglucosamine 4-epimerase
MGFIGSHIVPALLNNGHKVIGIDNNSNPSINPTDRIKAESGENWKNFIFFKADVTCLEHMLSICTNFQPDAIVHLAAIGSVPRSFEAPTKYIQNNEIGFLNILYLSQVFRVKKLIYASSSSVYGDTDVLPRTEGNEGRPLSPYALSKKHNEQVAQMWREMYGFNSIGLRFFNVYGPGQRSDSQYSAVIPRWLGATRIQVNGAGDTVRDFTFVGDVVGSIQCALLGKESHYIANVGTGQGTTLKDLAMLVSAGKKEIIFAEPRAGDVKESVASTTLLQSKIGYKPSTTIQEGIELARKFYAGAHESPRHAPLNGAAGSNLFAQDANEAQG